MTCINVNVNQLTRVEGHGNIVLNTRDGNIEEVRWEVTESPRFFEVMLHGRYYQDVPHISSRICGICSIAHSIASIQAVEAAFGIQPSDQTIMLRKLLFNAEILESHVLHTCFLVAPDFLETDSVFPLISTHPDIVLTALRMKKLAYNLAEALAGRKTHPISCIVGGFAKLPSMDEIKALRERLENAKADVDKIIKLVKTFNIPAFNRETEYIALKDAGEYTFISGEIASSDDGTRPLYDYLEITNEFCVPHSTAKYTRNKRDAYMVGALSRFNLNHAQLSVAAKAAAQLLCLSAPCHNPFMITVAQVVETVQVLEESLHIADYILANGLEAEETSVKVRAGRGIGAVEAPRGILFHDYTFDENGVLTAANCVIPTNQNHNNIQKDMEGLVPAIINQSENEIRHILEMMVRSYDPCISCSTH